MRRGLFSWVTVLVLAASVASCGGGDDGPAGTQSQRELAIRWYEWAASQPEDTNPVTDPDGSDCQVGQPDDIFFLASSLGESVERTCEIPADIEVVTPVVYSVCSPDTICDLGGADASATLDGESLEVFRVENEAFELSGAAENPITFAAETVEVIADGHWSRFGPLEPGEYVLELQGSDEDSGFSIDVTYTLIVG